ncbi:MAG: NUDIX hydrolase [Acidimicrobiia bacterium]
MTAPTVLAAGGVVWRRAEGGGMEVLLVHRPRYDDWSLPKGKLDAGETAPEAALREVAEETGLRCVLGDELPSSRYVDRRGRPKLVRYWAMQAVEGRFRPNAEVDMVRWLPVEEALRTLSYADDRALVAGLPAGVA